MFSFHTNKSIAIVIAFFICAFIIHVTFFKAALMSHETTEASHCLIVPVRV